MFIKNANNPQTASAVAVSPGFPDRAKQYLENLNISVLYGFAPQNPVSAVSFHIDTNFVHVRDNIFVVSKHYFSNQGQKLNHWSASICRLYLFQHQK